MCCYHSFETVESLSNLNIVWLRPNIGTMLAFSIPSALPFRSCNRTVRTRCPARACEEGTIQNVALSTKLATLTATLCEAGTAYIRGDARPRAGIVAEALSEAEKSARRARLDVDDTFITSGRWRLIFSANEKRAFYFPVLVEACWSDNRFINTVRLGPAEFVLSGPCQWLPKRNRLEFTFCEARLKCGPLKWSGDGLDKEGSSLEGRTKLPFFSFFLANDKLAGARGQGGGLAYWTRVVEDEG